MRRLRLTTRSSDTSATVVAGVFYAFLTVTFGSLLLTGCGADGEGNATPGQQAATAKAGPPLESTEAMRINTASGDHILKVELALTQAQQRKGLMFRREMPADHGMLFVYDEEQPIGMWMKNTIMPLDMLFISRDGTIVRIERNTEPFSERVIRSGQPVFGVLELNAGTADRLSIKNGDHIQHRLFGTN